MNEIKNKDISLGNGKYSYVHYIGCKFTDNEHTTFKNCKFDNCTFTNNRHVEFIKCDLNKQCKIY